ncbi:MAG: hypothetical protein MdMp014T_0866 [Treponematales bacterium]
METIYSANVLAVEGKDEQNFFESLLKFLNISGVQIIDVGGKDAFSTKLRLYLQSDGALDKIRNIGFIRDAEGHNAASAFQSICSVLRKYSLPTPQSVCEIAEQNNKRVGIFIMPNNNDCGMLEDLCLTSLSESNILPCIDGFIDCYKGKINTSQKYIPAKAKVLAYLSAQTPIVNSLGLAAKQGVWDFNNPAFAEIKNFLISLFG